MSSLYYKPIITHVTPTQSAFNDKTRTAYYDLTISIKNVPNDWSFRNEMFDALKEITPEDVKEWLRNKDIKFRNKHNKPKLEQVK